MLKQSKGVHTESEAEKDIPTQGDRPGTGHVASLPHGKEVILGSSLFSCSPVEVTDCMQEAE